MLESSCHLGHKPIVAFPHLHIDTNRHPTEILPVNVDNRLPGARISHLEKWGYIIESIGAHISCSSPSFLPSVRKPNCGSCCETMPILWKKYRVPQFCYVGPYFLYVGPDFFLQSLFTMLFVYLYAHNVNNFSPKYYTPQNMSQDPIVSPLKMF